jgi:hypothetical protein
MHYLILKCRLSGGSDALILGGDSGEEAVALAPEACSSAWSRARRKARLGAWVPRSALPIVHSTREA